jgi:hypothetical protein
MNQQAFSIEQAVNGIGQIAGDLVHPQPVCGGRDTSNLDAAGGQLDKERQQRGLGRLESAALGG